MKQRVMYPFGLFVCVFGLLVVPLGAQQHKQKKPAPTTVAAKRDAPAGHWPDWRGPAFNGVAATAAPTEWDTSKNIKWKAAIAGRGFSTPVIWGDKIFLTTAIPNASTTTATAPPPPAPTAPPPSSGNAGGPPNAPGGRGGRQVGGGGGAGAGVEQQFVVLCLDRKTGKQLWQQVAKVATPHEGYHRQYGSFASNSPVTDGKYLYAFFGSRGVYCYDLNGKLIWQKDFNLQLKMRLQFGEGGAPVLADDKLIMNFDHDGDVSFIVALDKMTGKEIWRTERDEKSTWTTPLVFEHAGRKQVVVTGTRRVRSYDVNTGKLIWECGGLGVNVIPQPIYHNGVLYVMSGYVNPKLMALQMGKEGDLTNTDAVLWTQTRGLSYTASPVLHEDKLYVLTDNGMISCFDAKTGTPFYHQQRLPKPYNFKASPLAANGKLYLASEDGDVILLKLGEQYEVLTTNSLPEQMFIASPIVAAGELFLRSQSQLFCISERSK